jgi:hypothetical protein
MESSTWSLWLSSYNVLVYWLPVQGSFEFHFRWWNCPSTFCFFENGTSFFFVGATERSSTGSYFGHWDGIICLPGRLVGKATFHQWRGCLRLKYCWREKFALLNEVRVNKFPGDCHLTLIWKRGLLSYSPFDCTK